MSPKTKLLNQKIEVAILKGKKEKLLNKGELSEADKNELHQIEEKLRRLGE